MYDAFPEIGSPGQSAPDLSAARAYRADDPELVGRGIRATGEGQLILADKLEKCDLNVRFDGSMGQSLTIGPGDGLAGMISLQGEASSAVFANPLASGAMPRINLTLADGAKACFGSRMSSIASAWTIYRKRLVVGDDLLASWDVYVRNYDGHSLFDLAEGHHLNEPRDLIIGPHCWIGQRAYIVKGLRIGRGAVIGACSVVTRDVPEQCAVAGSPARVVRENVGWSRKRYHGDH